jgi:glucosyl-dolichyl phosphate glucuronosyltransferase
MLYLALATYNGVTRLGRTLDSFTKLLPTKQPLRIIIVDNASNDGSMEVLQSFSQQLDLTLLSQPQPGKNHALNLAISHIRSHCAPTDLVVFTDDDVIADPNWLVNIEAIADEQKNYDIFGGAIDVEFPVSPPQWLYDLSDQFGVLFAQNLRADGPCLPQDCWGPNQAVRANLLLENEFDTQFGPNAALHHYAMGGESELMRRLGAKGYKAFFTSKALVHHVIRNDQLTLEWILARAFRHGLGEGKFAFRRALKAKTSVKPLYIFKHSLLHKLKQGLSKTKKLSDDFDQAWLEGWHKGWSLESEAH